MKYATNFQASSGCSIKRLFVAAAVVLASLSAWAQSASDSIVRPVASAYSLEVGASNIRDTYLTPLKYSGWNMSVGYERMQAMRFDPERWIMRLDARLSAGSAENPGKTATMWNIDFRPSWSMMRRFRPAPGLTVAAGGNVGLDLGALYILRGGNNPASIKASMTIGATAMAAYSWHIGKLPVTLRYQPTMPLVGAFFSPDYDELYYEIWLGNHSGLCHFAWPGSYFRLDNLVSADLHFGSTTLRVGYRCDIFSSKAADIVTRRIDHSFVIGIVSEWISLSTHSRRTPDARIISALYQ